MGKNSSTDVRFAGINMIFCLSEAIEDSFLLHYNLFHVFRIKIQAKK